MAAWLKQITLRDSRGGSSPPERSGAMDTPSEMRAKIVEELLSNLVYGGLFMRRLCGPR